MIGRYILSPAIFQYLSINQPGAGNEHQLTDAIALMMADHPVFAKQVEQARFDCGSKAGMLKATMHFAMKDPVLSKGRVLLLLVSLNINALKN